MRLGMNRDQDFNQAMFYLEQWIALLIGIACLAASLWAGLSGHKEFSLRHFSQFGGNSLVAIGWFLTIAVSFLGVTLMRFAFYKRKGPDVSTKPATGNGNAVNAGASKAHDRSKLVAVNRGRN